MQNNWFIIVNPKSGSGKGLKQWQKKVKKALDKADMSYEMAFTEQPAHAIELTMKAIAAGHRRLVAMGGDGTIHEVMNGILAQKNVKSTDISLSIIPVGTGNDWIKTLKIPADIDKAIDIIINGRHYLQDVGRAVYHEGKEQRERYFLNVGGTGFDAYVARKLDTKTDKTGKKIYLLELLKGIMGYKNIPMSLTSKAKDIKEDFFTINVSICKYFGSGMKIAPHAIPDDGFFDITLIKNISKWGVIKELRNLYNGSFLKNPHIETFKAKQVSVASTDDIYLQLDGELLGHGPFEFHIVPLSLKVMVAP